MISIILGIRFKKTTKYSYIKIFYKRHFIKNYRVLWINRSYPRCVIRFKIHLILIKNNESNLFNQY